MNTLIEATAGIGKPAWRDMLQYVARLHQKSVNPANETFPYPWEEIGPGYCYGPAFGHWDIIHAIFDVMAHEPEHAKQQLLNNFHNLEGDGFLPGVIYIRDGEFTWNTNATHPPVWPFAVQALFDQTNDAELLETAYRVLIRQIGWFENNRKAEPQGFYYTDILNHNWESGVDEGIRFLGEQTGPLACADATSHIYAMIDFAAKWAEILGKESGDYPAKAEALKTFISEKLFVDETGWFYDIWAVDDPSNRYMTHEGIWPLVVGAATPQQAEKAIKTNLMNSEKFFTAHPIPTVAADEALFELRMWRGPSWNSITFWTAKACQRYGFNSEARAILERALDASADIFAQTGTIWEFYHPFGKDPKTLQRKPQTQQNSPCNDYLGHNPLIAMAAMVAED